uniref:Uncharacterized protein n=1 Tax=Rhizophora mucronata TaxID=61149 RepID=A0A2P2NYE0_RHIMU
MPKWRRGRRRKGREGGSWRERRWREQKHTRNLSGQE